MVSCLSATWPKVSPKGYQSGLVQAGGQCQSNQPWQDPHRRGHDMEGQYLHFKYARWGPLPMTMAAGHQGGTPQVWSE